MLKGRESRTILNNTRLVLGRGVGGAPARITLTYHGNMIAGWTEDGTAQYTTAGWSTVTTHERLNAMVPARAGFFTKAHVGYVTDGERTLPSRGAILTVLPDGTMYAH